MTLQELVDEIDAQPVFEQDGKRAPHKPLTLLYSIGQALSGRRVVAYAEAEPALTALLDQFGPPRQQQHPEQPVWRLRQYRGQHTNFWHLDGPLSEVEGPGGNPRIPIMRERVSFGLSEQAAKLLCDNPANAYALAAMLAAKIAPPTLQGDLLEAVGLGTGEGPSPVLDEAIAAAASPELVARAVRTVTALVRDSAFSRKVRAAYNDSCAICSVSPRLADKVFGLEAAHIRWANAKGPDQLCNGICLCRMHHHALDKGAIKIDKDMRVQLSPRLSMSPEVDNLFARFSDKEIRLPRNAADHPHLTMLEWHWSEVFRG